MWQTSNLKDLVSIYPPCPTATPGKNTAKLFDQLPQPVEEKLDVGSLRTAIAEWDRDFAYSYPESIPPSRFAEEKIGGVPVTIYRDVNADMSTPTVLLLHGGGFFCELANVHRSLMANIAFRTPCHGVLPHYSLSPEVKAPQAIEETTFILQQLLLNPQKYGVTNNLVVVGYSSGGNLAWNAVLNIINSSEMKGLANKISQLVLMSPWADISMKTTKGGPYQHQQNTDKMLQTWGLEQMRDWYLPKGATGHEAVYSPIYRSTTSMKAMPKTTVIVGEIDRLLTDSIETVRVLKLANVPTQLVILEGQSHNHSVHVGLRDGVFTADIIAALMNNKSIANLKGADGLGIVTICQDSPELAEQSEKKMSTW